MVKASKNIISLWVCVSILFIQAAGFLLPCGCCNAKTQSCSESRKACYKQSDTEKASCCAHKTTGPEKTDHRTEGKCNSACLCKINDAKSAKKSATVFIQERQQKECGKIWFGVVEAHWFDISKTSILIHSFHPTKEIPLRTPLFSPLRI